MNLLNKLFTKTEPQLSITLPSKEWIEVSQVGDPYRFARKEHLQEELLEMFVVLYKKGQVPNPSIEDLIKLVQGEGKNKDLQDLQRIESGTCPFGTYSSNIFFSKEGSYVKIWYLSNGKDFIYVTFETKVRPNAQLDGELKSIVLSVIIRS
jgi:hypothetical protein